MVVGSEGRRAVSAHCRMRPRAGDVQASACGVALSGTSGLFGTPGPSGPQALSPVATVGTVCPFRLVRLVDPTGPLSGFRVSTGCSLLRSPLCRVVGSPRRHGQPVATASRSPVSLYLPRRPGKNGHGAFASGEDVCGVRYGVVTVRPGTAFHCERVADSAVCVGVGGAVTPWGVP